MKKALLLDTNVASYPIYKYLLKQGYETYVVGGNPTDSLAKYAEKYINLNYADIGKVAQLVDDLEIDYLVPGCNDLSYLSCVRLNVEKRFYGLEPLETTEIINNKEKFRQYAPTIGLSVPKLFKKEDLDFSCAVIVKPIDAYSGRGVTIIQPSEKDRLEAAVENAIDFSSSGRYIIEEYIQGQLYSHTTFIANGEIIIDFIVEEHGTANPFVVDTSRVIYDFPPAVLQKIRGQISRLSRELKLKDGLIHTQFIKTGDYFWLIEITKRCPGDLYSLLIEYSTGFQYAEFYTRPFLNQPLDLSSFTERRQFIMRHTISTPAEGGFIGLKYLEPICIESYIPLSMTGDFIKRSPFGRIGLLFVREDSEEGLKNVFTTTLKRNLYQIL